MTDTNVNTFVLASGTEVPVARWRQSKMAASTYKTQSCLVTHLVALLDLVGQPVVGDQQRSQGHQRERRHRTQ